MQQIDRLLHALEDLKQEVFANNPQLFATLAEALLDDLNRLRGEVDGYIQELKPSA